MFTTNRRSGARGPGRPSGPTAQGIRARRKLYETAIARIARRGYHATTLRDIARHAKVSPALLYKYFPSKRAVVLELYDRLSAEYAARALRMKPGPWRARFLFALRTSLRVLAAHRRTLAALVPVLVGDAEEGVFAEATRFSRLRVQAAFVTAVAGADDVPADRAVAESLGRLLYLAHLAVILFWMLDRSPRQRATTRLLHQMESALPYAALLMESPDAAAALVAVERTAGAALFRK